MSRPGTKYQILAQPTPTQNLGQKWTVDADVVLHDRGTTERNVHNFLHHFVLQKRRTALRSAFSSMRRSLFQDAMVTWDTFTVGTISMVKRLKLHNHFMNEYSISVTLLGWFFLKSFLHFMYWISPLLCTWRINWCIEEQRTVKWVSTTAARVYRTGWQDALAAQFLY